MDLNDGTRAETHFESWSPIRGRSFITERKERCDGAKTELLSVSHINGVVPRRNIVADTKQLSRAVSLDGYKRVYINDIVINTMLAWHGGVGHSAFDGAASPSYAVYSVSDSTSPRFVHYLFRSEQTKRLFKSWSTGIQDSRLRLYPDVLRRISFVMPDLVEQELIVRYLDHAELRISKTIQSKQKMVALLNEQKQVIISELVTRGLNPNVPMKDSGVLGLGEIPANWDLVRAKSIWRPVVSRSQTGLEQLLSVSSKFGPVPRKNLNVTMFMASSYVGHKRVRVNDLVINSLWSWAYGLGVSKHEGLVSTAYSVFELINPSVADPDYMNYLLRSVPMQWQFQVSSKGIWKSRLQLTDSSFGSFTLLLPSIEEQRTIASSIVNKTFDIETAISAVEQEIELLKEYRTVLISDVVTGKKDVRAEAADLPDVDPVELAQVLSGAASVDAEEDEDDGTSEVE